MRSITESARRAEQATPDSDGGRSHPSVSGRLVMQTEPRQESGDERVQNKLSVARGEHRLNSLFKNARLVNVLSGGDLPDECGGG